MTSSGSLMNALVRQDIKELDGSLFQKAPPVIDLTAITRYSHRGAHSSLHWYPLSTSRSGVISIMRP